MLMLSGFELYPRWVPLNSARHQHDTERTQKRAGCSHRQLFRPLWGSSVWRKNQRSGSDKKISAHSDFSPDLELLRTHRITPYHVSSGGQESKCQVDVSQRKNFKCKISSHLKYMNKDLQQLIMHSQRSSTSRSFNWYTN